MNGQQADLDAADRAALERCTEIFTKRSAANAEQIQGKLEQGDPWVECAELACWQPSVTR
jgi:hypothetical protein